MTQTDPHFEALLVYLKETRGFDFTGYKRSSLVRRVDRRMATVGAVQHHPHQRDGLFRDSEAWDYLKTEVLEATLAQKPADSPVRVWSAGCASGEEACTLAMTLAEVLGPEQFRRRVKIYATDVDEEALAHARLAGYSEHDVQSVPEKLLEKYFEVRADRYLFRKDLRRSVIFGRNDLVQDAPISRIDLLVCRNTLMYLNAETQGRILSRFHLGASLLE